MDHLVLYLSCKFSEQEVRYLTLQPFKFKVNHRPGAQMVVGDFLFCLSQQGGEQLVVGRMATQPKAGSGDMWCEGGVAWHRLQIVGR